MKKIKSKANIDLLFNLIEDEHGGCDQNSCTLGVALKEGYALVAIDHWIGSGAASGAFNVEAKKGLPFSFKDVQKEHKQMSQDLDHAFCDECNSVVWQPEWCGYQCDSCGHKLPKLDSKSIRKSV